MPAFAPSLLFGLGEGAILPVVPLTARELGGSVPQAALMVTLIGIGSMVSNVPASMITMRQGERWALVAAAVWCALAMALCAWTESLVLFAVGCFMVGMSQAVFSLARQSYLAEAVPMEYRARVMSTMGGVTRIGMFIGPFLAALAIRHYGLAGSYGVGVAALLCAAVIAARLPSLEPATAAVGAQAAGEPASAPTFASILRRHRKVLVTLGLGIMLVSAVRAARQVVVPLWGDHLGLEPSLTALIYGVANGVDMLVFYPAGMVMDRKGRSWVAVPSLLIMGVALLLTPLAHGAWGLLLAAVAIGFGNGIGSGLILTIGADHSPRHGRAHFLGLWRMMSDIGSACGPALLSFLAATLSLGSAIALIALLAFAGAAQLAWWLPRVPRPDDS